MMIQLTKELNELQDRTMDIQQTTATKICQPMTSTIINELYYYYYY